MAVTLTHAFCEFSALIGLSYELDKASKAMIDPI